MNTLLLYPFAASLVGAVAGLRLWRRGVGGILPFIYWWLLPFAVLGFITFATAYLYPDEAPYALAGATAALLLIVLTRKVHSERPWVMERWVAYIPPVTIIATGVLLAHGLPAFALMNTYAPSSTWMITLMAIASILLLFAGWKSLLGYSLAPALALIRRRLHWHWQSPLYFRLMQAAHRYSGLPQLDLRKEALNYYSSQGMHRQAARVAEELGDLDQALGEYEKAGDDLGQARMLAQLGRPLEAAQCYERAGRLAEAARSFEEAGDLPKAASLYKQGGLREEFVRVCRRGRLHLELARFFEEHRQHGQAAQAYEEAGEYEKAAAAYEREGNYRRAGALYIELGDLDKAEEMYHKAGDLFPFYDALRRKGKSQRLEAAKARLLTGYIEVRAAQEQHRPRDAERGYPYLLEHLGALDPKDAQESSLARQIAWSAITFFEEKHRDLRRVHQAALTLKGFLDRGAQLEPIEVLALLARIMLLEAFHRNYGNVEGCVDEFLEALAKQPVEELDEKEKNFLKQMMLGTLQVLRSHGQIQLAKRIAGRFANAPISI